MGLGSILRSAIATANSITGGTDGLQVDVTVEAFDSYDGYGKPTYGSSETISCVLEQKTRFMRAPGGQEVVSKHCLTFVQPVEIGPKDRITLPDGSTGPILDIEGVMDSETSRAFCTEVTLG